MLKVDALNGLPSQAQSVLDGMMHSDASICQKLDYLHNASSKWNWSLADRVEIMHHYNWTSDKISEAYHKYCDQSPTLREPLVGFTANMIPYLDPFEFSPKRSDGTGEGSYGELIDIVKKEVEKLVIERSAGQENPSIRDIAIDAHYGPLFNEMFPSELRGYFMERIREHNRFAEEHNKKAPAREQIPLYDMEKMKKIEALYQKMDGKRFSHFAKNCFPPFTVLDKTLRDKFENAGRDFTAPILSSCGPIPTDPRKVIDWLFEEQAIACTEPMNVMEEKWKRIKPEERQKALAAMKRCFGDAITEEEIKLFLSIEGQVSFFLPYQLLNNYLVKDMVKYVNEAKKKFNEGLGNAGFRAKIYQQTFAKFKAMIVGVQEGKNPIIARAMEEVGFHSTAQQVSMDGSRVFLHRDFFEEEYEVRKLEIKNRLGLPDEEGKAMGIIGTRTRTGQKVYAGSCHGSAKDPKDIFRQIDALQKDFREQQLLYPDMVFVLFVDANPNGKKEEDEFIEGCRERGFKLTAHPKTKLSMRTVTNMHSKSYVPSEGRKDFILVPEWQALEYETVAFGKELKDPLPNLKNPSDHAAVGAVIHPMGSDILSPAQMVPAAG